MPLEARAELPVGVDQLLLIHNFGCAEPPGLTQVLNPTALPRMGVFGWISDESRSALDRQARRRLEATSRKAPIRTARAPPNSTAGDTGSPVNASMAACCATAFVTAAGVTAATVKA